MHTTPPSLLERLRNPDERHAWDAFVRLYTPLLFYWARRAGLPDPDAADLVQDVFMVLLQKLPEFRYEKGKSFRSWLRTITLNKWRDHRRRRTPVVGVGDREPAVADDVELFTEEEYRRHIVAEALRLMQAEFPENTWRACWEYVVHDRPAAEVAAELGVSVGTVYSAKCRILARLRVELGGLVD